MSFDGPHFDERFALERSSLQATKVGCASYRSADTRTAPRHIGVIRQHERALSALSGVEAGRYEDALRAHRELSDLRALLVRDGELDATQLALDALYEHAARSVLAYLASPSDSQELSAIAEVLRAVHARLVASTL